MGILDGKDEYHSRKSRERAEQRKSPARKEQEKNDADAFKKEQHEAEQAREHYYDDTGNKCYK